MNARLRVPRATEILWKQCVPELMRFASMYTDELSHIETAVERGYEMGVNGPLESEPPIAFWPRCYAGVRDYFVDPGVLPPLLIINRETTGWHDDVLSAFDANDDRSWEVLVLSQGGAARLDEGEIAYVIGVGEGEVRRIMADLKDRSQNIDH